MVTVLYFARLRETLGKSSERLELPGDVYFIKTLPVLVQWQDLLLIGASSVVICFLATVYPSWEASRLTPVEAIRDL